MSDDTLKTFDNLSSISNQDIDDALDIIPISHGVGTISQGDKKVKIGQLQQMTVLRCRTNGNVANKQAEYVGGLPLNGNSQACIGRTVLVIFDNKNTAAEPTFSYKNLNGPIILLNQASNVTLGSGCVLANSRNIMTWDGQNWCLHSDIAEITSNYTKYADGRILYNDNVEVLHITSNNFVFNGSVLKCGKLVIINLYGFFAESLSAGSIFMSGLPIPKSRIVTNINSKELILDTNGNISVQNEVTVEWIEGEIVYFIN